MLSSKLIVRSSIYAIFAIGIFFLGYLAKPGAFSPSDDPKKISQQIRQGGYEFINPLLECEYGASLSTYLKSFSNALEVEIDDAVARRRITKAAIYFRDLNNGPTISVNGDEQFFPASLLKLPTLIAYYKLAENNPASLEKKITFTQKHYDDTIQFFPPRQKLVLGKTYTANELIEQMIQESDNEAAYLLTANIDLKDLKNIYSDFGLTIPSTIDYQLSVRQYASFYRILYNASYLNKEYSERALKLLNQATFTRGLRTGVPRELNISHKFGESGKGKETQFHDCGIVYFPKKPYLLCVMTQGNNPEQLVKFIEKISEITYLQVASQTALE